jgi:hypothetical protein
MSEKKATRTVSTKRLEDIRTRKGLSVHQFLAEMQVTATENPTMNFQECITAYAKANSLRGGNGTDSDPVKDALRATMPTLNETKGCEVTLIRQHKDDAGNYINKYSVTCKLDTGVNNTLWCEVNGNQMNYGIQNITVGSCALVGPTSPAADSVETDKVYETHMDEVDF